MRKVEHRLRLDLLRGGNQGYIRVKRGENGARRLAIALYMHSVPYMADAGTTAVFRAIKPDNTQLFNSSTITDNVVTVGLTTQTVAALGTVRCELSIYGMNNELLYSPQFDIVVEDNLYDDGAIESTNEYTELTQTLASIRASQAEIDAITQQMGSWETAEAGRATAEIARAEAEEARATAETARASAESARVMAETERTAAEDIRVEAEENRISDEDGRAANEALRIANETTRNNNETSRISAENGRVTAESGRVSAETARAEAEESRATLYAEWNGLTVEAQDGDAADAELNDVSGHKNILFTLPRGKGFTVLGQFMTLEALQSAVTTPKGGDAYGVGSTAPYDIYIWDKVENKWKNHGKLQGPQGNSGAAAGFGTPAASASKLAASAQATVAVTASGPDTAKVFTFEFGIPQGEPGDTGPNEVTSSTATNLTGLLKGNGTNVEAAVPEVDYATPEQTKVFMVTFSGNDDGSIVADKSTAEIYSAYMAGKVVVGKLDSSVYQLCIMNPTSGSYMMFICCSGLYMSTIESVGDDGWANHDYILTVPNSENALPGSGIELQRDIVYTVSAAVDTYAFEPPQDGWAHGTFTTGTAPNITFTGKIVGKLPTFEASKQYEFDVLDGAWVVQEVLTQ